MLNFQVNDMTCSHCVATVERAVRSVDSTASVKIDLASLAVAINSTKPAASFADAIKAAGYTPELRG
jgi:copper chaperone